MAGHLFVHTVTIQESIKVKVAGLSSEIEESLSPQMRVVYE
jgi:hypothetical protein